MNFAVHGFLADGAGSGAGAFPVLLRRLLERGHSVDFFGVPVFTEPKSLLPFPRYRFHAVSAPGSDTLWRIARALPTQYPSALCSQVTHLMHQRETVRRMEVESRTSRYDVIVCTDAQALWPSKLPVVCWPQSPPHTEGAALRTRELVPSVVRSMGAPHYLAVQLFYAYRYALARTALDFSDIYLCGSAWARDEWRRFGARPERLRTIAYPIDVTRFENAPPLGANARGVTFLWLGRATPRKRLDLFLAGFERLHAREPTVRAHLVGGLRSNPYASRILEPYLGHPAIRVDDAWPHAKIPELFGEVNVLVQPSQNENFGFSVAEALAAGRAIVLGPTNGTADYGDGASFVFSEYRPESVAAAMDRARLAVLRSGPELTALARAAARRHFTIDAVADRFSELCSEALDRRRTAL